MVLTQCDRCPYREERAQTHTEARLDEDTEDASASQGQASGETNRADTENPASRSVKR